MTNKKKKISIFEDLAVQFIDSYFQEVIKCIVLLNKGNIERIIEKVHDAYIADKKIYILGNGGGASISSHMACDLGKGTLARTYDQKEKRLHVISLTDNVATMTAYANDISYDEIFVQQLRNLVEKDDVVIGISGSGNSKNVINAILYAKKRGAVTIGFTGFKKGGKLSEITDVSIVAQTNHYGPIEDIHGMIGHLITAFIAKLKHSESANGKTLKNKSIPFFIN
jgi:D-sedoheptulose 7-phosphate isomerase